MDKQIKPKEKSKEKSVLKEVTKKPAKKLITKSSKKEHVLKEVTKKPAKKLIKKSNKKESVSKDFSKKQIKKIKIGGKGDNLGSAIKGVFQALHDVGSSMLNEFNDIKNINNEIENPPAPSPSNPGVVQTNG